MSQDILAPDKAEIENYEQADVFLWANNLVQYKDELAIDLFFINKNYVVYRTSLAKELKKQLEPLFVDELLEFVLGGAETGLTVRGFEEAEAEDGVLQYTQVFKVEKLREVLRWIETQEHEIELFKEEDHDFRRIKGVVARIQHPGMGKPFYAMKVLPQTAIMRGKVGWMLRDGKFVPFDADAALRIPIDNQLLVIDQDVFVFNQTKLKQLFGYDAKEASIAAKKAALIERDFRLSFADGLNLQTMLAGKRSLIKKLQNVELEGMKQEAMLDHAEELGVDLMLDDSGAIIIMDDKDLTKFVNLLNDDYLESGLTGQKYEVMRKRPIRQKEESALALPGA
ncbi:MAG TPA: Kiwa anti-phage protein KwaB-like domain-containing protein [Candidatus Acidoferrum sp.]|nr:Kiwa anti-phage protein KwaB-like domain-containing protein [Candidatus Acidoferrum sp.]